VLLSAPLPAWSTIGSIESTGGMASRIRSSVGLAGTCRANTGRVRHDAFRLRRLSLISAQHPVFQRCAIEAADDGLHFFRIRCVDEGEALRLLRFGVANDFYVIVDEVFRVEPGFDVILGHPDRKISEENGITHSLCVFNSVGDLRDLLRGRDP